MYLADAHVHFFESGYRSRYGPLFPAGGEIAIYQAFRREHEITDVLAIGYEEPPYGGNNGYLSKLAHEHGWIHPLAYCAPEAPPTMAAAERLWAAGFLGLSIYVATERHVAALLQWPSDLFKTLNRRGALLSINAPLGYLSTLNPFFKKLPSCQILLSHLGLTGGIAEGECALKISPLGSLAELPNIGIKASGFYASGEKLFDYPHAFSRRVFAYLLGVYGPERLYWGSDFSPALEHVSFIQTIEVLTSLNIPEEQQAAIFGGNLQRLIKKTHS